MKTLIGAHAIKEARTLPALAGWIRRLLAGRAETCIIAEASQRDFIFQKLERKIHASPNWIARSILPLAITLSPATSFGQTLTFQQFDHFAQRFLHEAPNEIILMTESADGLLWVVSGSQLLTFDGLHMVPYLPPPGQPTLPLDVPTALYTAKDGTIWVGYVTGEVAHVSGDHIEVFGHASGIPGENIESLFQDFSGRVIAVTDAGVFIQQGKAWSLYQAALPNSQMMIDSSDTLWGVTPNKIYWLPKGEHAFKNLKTPAWTAGVIHEGPDHTMWAITHLQTETEVYRKCALRRLSLPGHPGSALSIPIPCVSNRRDDMRIDADGSIWIASLSGALHVQSTRQVSGRRSKFNWTTEGFTAKDGLTSDSLDLVLRDSFGNIWFGGKDGLDRFTPPILHKRFSIPQHEFKIAAGPTGHVWVAGWHEALRLIGNGDNTTYGSAKAWSVLYGARDGTVWAATTHPLGFGFATPGSKRFENVPLPPNPVDSLAQAIAEDSKSILVAYDGLWRFTHGTWTPIDQGPLAGNEPISMLCDRTDRVWLGYGDGSFGALHKGVVRRFVGDIGMVEVFLESTRGIFAGGAKGIAFFDGHGFRSLRTDDPLSVRNVSGMIQAPNGDLWLNGEEGVVLISATEVEHALANPSYIMQLQSFSGGDLSGGRTPWVRPSAIVDRSGGAWFSISRYLAYLDLSHTTQVRPPSRVSIRDIKADNFPLRSQEAVPAGTNTLSIDYVGINLAAPEQVRYRYRLAGEEKQWRDAGRGTEAIYTGLRNGTYHFELMASNGAGVWTALGAPITIKVLPLYYQTVWFRLVCIIASVGSLILFVRFRVQVAESQLRAHLSGRYGERLRISRDLHDTLLQGVQGLTMRLTALTREIKGQPEVSQRMEDALQKADLLMIEGRDRVRDLRSDSHEHVDLKAGLQRIADQHLGDAEIARKFEEKGKPQQLDPSVRSEVDAIAREILLNITKHAQATEIRISILYKRKALHVVIEDNGVGIPPEILATGSRQGHWGLQGMRERAAEVGGHLSVSCGNTPGTCVELVVPASIAYRRVG